MVPSGWSGSCSRPPFFKSTTGGTRRLASSPGPNSASDQPGLPFPPSPATTYQTHSSPGTTHSRHAASPTHRLHGRGHVVVSLRLLGQAGSLQQLLSVPHSRFRGGCWAGHSAPLGERRRRGGDPRRETHGWCEWGTRPEPPPPPPASRSPAQRPRDASPLRAGASRSGPRQGGQSSRALAASPAPRAPLAPLRPAGSLALLPPPAPAR